MAEAFANARKQLSFGLALCILGVLVTGGADRFVDLLAGAALFLFLAAQVARPVDRADGDVPRRLTGPPDQEGLPFNPAVPPAESHVEPDRQAA